MDEIRLRAGVPSADWLLAEAEQVNVDGFVVADGAAETLASGVFVTSAPDEAARALPARMTLVRGEGEAALLAMARSRRSPQADESMGPGPFDSSSD